MFRKLFYPHSLIVTCMVFILIWVLDIVRINFHFLNPFNEAIRDYEITDIVYSRLRSKKISFDERIVLVNTGQPNRDKLRMMIDRIVDAGAKVIAVDIKLTKRMNPHTDSLLRQSLMRMENVVLAIELEGYNFEKDELERKTGCDTFFCDYVYTGFINFVVPDTSTVRYFSPKEMTGNEAVLSFSAQIAQLYDPNAAERLFKRKKLLEEIYYAGDENQFFQFEPYQILDSTLDLRKRLKDKIVIIGFLGSYAWDEDRHYTPLNHHYTAHNSPDMYGMVIHANIIRMILDNTYVRELSFWINLLLTFIFCYFNIHLFYRIFRRVSVPYQFITRFLQLGEIIILFFIVALLFHFYRVKMEVAYWITALLLTFDAVKFYDNGIRKRFGFLSKIPFELPPVQKAVKETVKVVEAPQQEPQDVPEKLVKPNLKK